MTSVLTRARYIRNDQQAVAWTQLRLAVFEHGNDGRTLVVRRHQDCDAPTTFNARTHREWRSEESRHDLNTKHSGRNRDHSREGQ
jgi:hypothetical protein